MTTNAPRTPKDIEREYAEVCMLIGDTYAKAQLQIDGYRQRIFQLEMELRKYRELNPADAK